MLTLTAGKGVAMVIMDKQDYMEKAKTFQKKQHKVF